MRIWKVLDNRMEEFLSVILLSSMCVLIFLQIIFRYCFKLPLAWTEEIARYAFIWLIYMGCSLGVKRRRHLKVDAVLLMFKEKGIFILKMISNILTMMFSAIMAYYGTYMVYLLTFVRFQKSPAVGIPMAIPYLSVSLGMIFMTVRLIQDCVLLIREHRLGSHVDIAEELKNQALDDVSVSQFEKKN